MARWTASAKWAEGPALDGQRDMPLGLSLSEGLGVSEVHNARSFRVLLKVCSLKVFTPRIVVVMKSDTPATTVGETVRRLREREGISQEELADRCGLHRTYVGSVERGERNVSLANIVRLAKALNVSPASLLEGVR